MSSSLPHSHLTMTNIENSDITILEKKQLKEELINTSINLILVYMFQTEKE